MLLNVGILIVPERFIEAWKDENTKDKESRFPTNLKIMTFKEFKSIISNTRNNETILASFDLFNL